MARALDEDGKTPLGLTEQDLAATEAAIRAAEHYVVPSQDLRPQVIEAARAEKSGASLRRRIGLAAAACLLVALAIETGIYNSRLQHRSRLQASAAEAHLIETGKRSNANFGWGIVEFLLDLRSQQAEAINAPSK